MTTNGRINHHRELFPSPSCLPVVVRAEVLIIKGLLFQQYLLVRPKERTHWAFFFFLFMQVPYQRGVFYFRICRRDYKRNWLRVLSKRRNNCVTS